MTASAKIPEGILTVGRGVQTKTIDFQGIPVEIKIKVLTNAEANALTNEFTDLVGGDLDVDLVRLAEERILRSLIDINTTFDGKSWPDLSEKEKREVIQILHPELREKIGNEIFGKTYLTKEEKDFLQQHLSQDK